MTRLLGRKFGIRLLRVEICTESSLNILKHFSLMKNLKYTASLIMTATLQDSDFVKQNEVTQTNTMIPISTVKILWEVLCHMIKRKNL